MIVTELHLLFKLTVYLLYKKYTQHKISIPNMLICELDFLFLIY